LVIAAHTARDIALYVLLEGPEVTTDRRPAELVVERGRADRPVDHDVERGGNPLGLAEIGLPGPLVTGYAQVGDGESRQPRFGLRAAARGALIPDLSAGAGRGARERRDGGGMIVGLDLHQDVDGLGHPGVDTRAGLREITDTPRPFDHRRIVTI